MNERILELRTQAAAWVAKNHQPQDPNAYSQKEIDQRYLMYEEKFAELIVRESIARVEGCAVEFDDNYPNDQFIAGYNKGISKTASQVKQHFGVEE